MNFEFDVESTRIEFSRSAMWGTMSIKADGETVAADSARDLSTHFNFRFTRRFTIPVATRQEVVIEYQRPLLFPGFRPHIYRVFVDGQLVEEHKGY